MSPVEVGTASGFAGAAAVAGLLAFVRYYPAIAAKLEGVSTVTRAAPTAPSPDAAVAVLQSEMEQAQGDIRDLRGELRVIHGTLGDVRDDLSSIKGKLDLLLGLKAH